MRISALKSAAIVLLAGSVAQAADTAPDMSISGEYREDAEKIIRAAQSGSGAYLRLQQLCDDIGHRICGSEGLNAAVRWAQQSMRDDGHENVRLETVMVPRWIRGEESCTMIAPRRQPLAMLGLGFSVGTPPGGITAPVVVVQDEQELDRLGSAVRGKIVLFNNIMPPYSAERGTGYGRAVRFRSNGARLAAEKGAVACLIRSVTARSLRSPHTGMMKYGDAVVKIPAAALSIEDAEMIARLQARNIPVEVRLEMEARYEGEVPSANVVAELRGSAFADEIVVIGGHIDSWDVGQGAHDDGGGCVMAMEALHLLRKLDLRPRRTIRVVLWTGEEMGLFGGKQYAKDHADELPRHVAAIESDIGSFAPRGYSIDCTDEKRLRVAADQLQEILGLCRGVGALDVSVGYSAPDVSPMKPAGVILMGHEVDVSHYFDYHHTQADTVDKVDPVELGRNVAIMATVAYVIADMPTRLGETGSAR